MYRLYSFLVTVAIVTSTVLVASCENKTVDTDKNFTVIFNSNGGSSVESQTIKEGEKVSKPTPDPRKADNSFEGWFKETTLTTEWQFNNDVVKSSFTLYAKWTPITVDDIIYTVTFESNGGSPVESKTVKEGQKVPKPTPNPTKNGNRFMGWYRESTLITEWRFNIDEIPSDITLYAKWTPYDVIETKEDVLTFLKECTTEGNILFGHHLDLTKGINENKTIWTYDFKSDKEEPTRSDVYRITGKFPAVLGMDVFEPFQRRNNAEIQSMMYAVNIFARQMNGLIAISCHMENPWWDVEGKRQGASYRYISPNHKNVVREILEKDGPVQHSAGFTVMQFYNSKMDEAINAMRSMKFENGKQIPLMVRLFHEGSREFFWWGADYGTVTGLCTDEEYIELYRYTVNYMKSRCDNLMFVYAPDRNWTTMNISDSFMKRYPGDDYVDVIGYDDYFLEYKGAGTGMKFDASAAEAITRMKALSQYAKTHDKVVCLAETGMMDKRSILDQPTWYTTYLYKVLTAADVSVSFFLLWSSWIATPPELPLDSGWMFPFKYDSPEADDVRNFISRDRIKMSDFMPMQ